ncbi:MAG: ATP-grasp domain-containing protein [Phycisphaerales bacterium]|nr:ATP-grasp domain-containing protein [Phycisphaerae bacterium]NNF43904.1 ATP-grasp domain-containing protein [Phycisphaerales bacterium]NNM24679.1 ATP-grasp domain-containing protein [Phycisphaerales bacterium]
MTSVAFLAPYAAPATLRFVRAVAGTPGVRCGLITQEPLERLPADVRSGLAGHWRIDDALDPTQIAAATRSLENQIGPVERLVGILEQAQVAMAEARAMLGLPGMDAATAENFRDKARMKSVLRDAGLPCARHALVRSVDEAVAFAERTGFPLVVKPPAGAGARATYRVENVADLRQGLAVSQPSPASPALLEEFMTGREFSFDSVFVRGDLVWHSFCHYFPSPLEVMENPWIQWCVLLPRHIDDAAHERVRTVTTEAIRTLGLSTGMTHLEWFLRPGGDIALSEVAARPPGAQFTSLISWAHDADFYKGWADLVAHERFDPPPRRYAVAGVYLRGQGGARVAAVHGLDAAQSEIGRLVVESHLPRPGQPASGTYEGDGYVILRHEETEVVKQAARRLLDLVKVEMA